MKRIRKLIFTKSKHWIDELSYSTLTDSTLVFYFIRYCENKSNYKLKSFTTSLFDDEKVVKIKCNKKDFLKLISDFSKDFSDNVDNIHFN